MTLTTVGKNAALNELRTAELLYLAAYTADPGSSATANEVSGGGYARQSLTWSAASGGSISISNDPIVFNIGAGVTVAYLGIVDAASGGSLHWKNNITDEVFGSAGTLTVDDIDIDLNK